MAPRGCCFLPMLLAADGREWLGRRLGSQKGGGGTCPLSNASLVEGLGGWGGAAEYIPALLSCGVPPPPLHAPCSGCPVSTSQRRQSGEGATRTNERTESLVQTA